MTDEETAFWSMLDNLKRPTVEEVKRKFLGKYEGKELYLVYKAVYDIYERFLLLEYNMFNESFKHIYNEDYDDLQHFYYWMHGELWKVFPDLDKSYKKARRLKGILPENVSVLPVNNVKEWNDYASQHKPGTMQFGVVLSEVSWFMAKRFMDANTVLSYAEKKKDKFNKSKYDKALFESAIDIYCRAFQKGDESDYRSALFEAVGQSPKYSYISRDSEEFDKIDAAFRVWRCRESRNSKAKGLNVRR